MVGSTTTSRWRQQARRIDTGSALWAIPPLSALVGCVSLAHGDAGRIGDLGLITAIPPPVFASVALLALGFAAALREPRLRPGLLASHLLVLVLLLPGAASLLEPEPRFASAWLHAGFVDQIARTGHTLPFLDARFDWPGFFAAAALLLRGVGIRDPAPVLSWAPVAFGLLALVPVSLIAALTTEDPRVPWLAAWLFVPANWVGQDYFSPQAFAFTLFLGFMVVLLRYFGGRRAAARERSATRTRRERLAAARVAPRLGGLLAILLLVYAAIVWSHQLTPYFAFAATTALVAVRACRLRTLPILLAVIATAFVSYLAVAYWSGHLGDIFGGVGALGSTVSSNVGDRVAASSGTHDWVARLRIAITVAVWTLALAGAVLRWRGGRQIVPLLVLLAVPYSVLAIQSYGGEVLLRAHLFALPFAAALMGAALAGAVRPDGRVAVASVVPLLTVVLAAGFYVARFGNEAFEMTRRGEVVVLQRLYRIAPAGSTLVRIDDNLPWRFTSIARYRYETRPLRRTTPRRYLANLRGLLARNPASGYVVISRGQIEGQRLVLGVPARRVARLQRLLSTAPDFALVDAAPDARVYAYIESRGVRRAR